MFKLNHPQKSPLYTYHAPAGELPRGLVSIPHSGEDIPDAFRPYLSGDEEAYRSDVDTKVNELVDIKALQAQGVAVLVAHVHRICVDLNRAEDNCLLFWKENTHGRALVVKDPEAALAEELRLTFYRPYFEIMKSFIQELEKRVPHRVPVIDLHSMPSRPTAYHLKQNPNQNAQRPDFCLSDRKGKTCDPEYIRFFQQGLERRGFSATLNDPYVGGFITEWVDRFRTNNIQIEINRASYLDEVSRELTPGSARVREALTAVLLEGFETYSR
jgi:N-formylglutamate deformylase